jgi:hypothetical protein
MLYFCTLKGLPAMYNAFQQFLRSDFLTVLAKRLLRIIGYDPTHWVRVRMQEECTIHLEKIGIEELDTLEISAGLYWRTLKFRSYMEANYPEFDICKDILDRQFDLIIADQVFEHLLWPYRGARNVFSMLHPGGYFLISTPFLIRVHAVPYDCSRWTETGLRYFLSEAGFPIDSTITGSWGNRKCVKANFNRWARKGWFRSSQNEPDFPVTVWALAQRPHLDEDRDRLQSATMVAECDERHAR